MRVVTFLLIQVDGGAHKTMSMQGGKKKNKKKTRSGRKKQEKGENK